MDAAAFLAAAAAASLAAPEPLDFVGLVRGGLFFLEFLEEAAVVADFFLLVGRTSESLSLLSLKILLYLSTVFRLEVADLEEVANEVELLVVVLVVGVDDGLTEGEACDPGEDEAAMAAFLACCALAANLGSE